MSLLRNLLHSLPSELIEIVVLANILSIHSSALREYHTNGETS